MLIITSWDKMTSCRIEKKMGHFFNSDPESTLLPKRRYNQHQCFPNSQIRPLVRDLFPVNMCLERLCIILFCLMGH